MAEVITANYRYVTHEEGDEYATRHTLTPGDDPSDLPEEVYDDLKEQGLIMDENRFDKATGVVLPAEEALRRMERARTYAQTHPVGEAPSTGTVSGDEPQSGDKEGTAKQRQAAKAGSTSTTGGNGENTGSTGDKGDK